MFSSLTSYVIMGMLLMILFMAGTGYWYFSYSQREMGVLRENAAKLELAVQTQQQTIQAQQESQQRTNREMMDLQTRLGSAERNRRELEIRIRRMNLESQARTNRQDVEVRINQATQQVFRELEQLTQPQTGGAPQAATTPATTTRTPVRVPPTGDAQPAPRPPVRSVRP